MKTKKCSFCKNEFSRDWFNKKRKIFFCSKECKNKFHSISMRGKNNSNYRDAIEIFKCSFCDKDVEDYKNYAKDKEHHYCDKECKNKHHSTIMKGKLAGDKNPMFGIKGKDNPNYKGNYKYCEICHKKVSNKNITGRCIKHVDRKGKNNSRFGVKASLITRDKIRKSLLSRSNKISPLSIDIRKLVEYVNWRTSVFKRDNYTCQECYKKSGNRKAVYLEVHHIKEFYSILCEFLNEYSQFSPIEDKETLIRLAISYKAFWDIDNGKTLCKECHDKTKRGRISAVENTINA